MRERATRIDELADGNYWATDKTVRILKQIKNELDFV